MPEQIFPRPDLRPYLGQTVTIGIDRPIGYVHRKGEKTLIYPINYGYIPDVLGGDGEELDVYLLGVDAIPTWVNLRPVSDTKKEFNILPLKYDNVDQWQSLYELTDSALESAKKSYDRTMDIIGDGLTECKSHFGTAKTDREEAYYTQANTPA